MLRINFTTKKLAVCLSMHEILRLRRIAAQNDTLHEEIIACEKS
jgi:hypothetical protein